MYHSKRPEFTQEQSDFISATICDWYLDWKNQIVTREVTHRLGFAKEILKVMLVGDGSKEVYYKKFTINIYDGNRFELRYNPINMVIYKDTESYKSEDDAIQAAKAKIDEYNLE